jgi:splicing factor 3A subunit 2
MDYQNRAGSKFGGGGVASQSATNADRRERLRKLALETIDLDKDPYFFKNHVGSFECRLCLTVHQNDGSYLAHTQGRKHQTNLARRNAREEKDQKNRDGVTPGLLAGVPVKQRTEPVIGRPGYRVTKIRDPLSRQNGLLFQLQYPELRPGVVPRMRVMSAYEQKVEDPPDTNFQYIVIAAEPYETVAFKIQARELDRSSSKYFTWFDEDSKEFWAQIVFKTEREERYAGVPGLAPGRR